MELRQFADRVLFSESLAEKLRPADLPWSDDDPGPPERVAAPARAPNLRFAPPRTAPAMPAPEALADPAKRAIAHHIMANHELQALEVMALVLRAFPDAHREFRLGLARIMADEQKHTRMHAERAAILGVRFGDLPVNCYIWNKALAFESVLDYLAGLPLVFENRNLDHTLEFERHFLNAGDDRSAAIVRIIHRDEIAHVAFGLEWLKKLKRPDQSDWEAWQHHLHWPLRPEKAAASPFHHEPRRAAGMSDDFLQRLERAAASPPPDR